MGAGNGTGKGMAGKGMAGTGKAFSSKYFIVKGRPRFPSSSSFPFFQSPPHVIRRDGYTHPPESWKHMKGRFHLLNRVIREGPLKSKDLDLFGDETDYPCWQGFPSIDVKTMRIRYNYVGRILEKG